MPYCTYNDTKLFYKTHGGGPTKVLLIIGTNEIHHFDNLGLAGTHCSWGPQIEGLMGVDGVEVCAFDNRGVGESSVPMRKSEYTTTIMAKDAIALMDHLEWRKAHVFGHSMGAMISCKLAAMVPERVMSLGLLNVTGGGFQCIPKLDRKTISIAIRFLKAKTPEQRAEVDLDTHYSKEYLEEHVGTIRRRAILYQQYVKGISSTGMQSKHGFKGQVNACWTHTVTLTEIERIRHAGILVSVIHGRDDVIAQVDHARRLAEKLYPVARMVNLPGGHLVSRERTEEVNQAIVDLINASESGLSPDDWTNIPNQNSGWVEISISSIIPCSNGGTHDSIMSHMLKKLNFCLLYLFGLFLFAYDYARRVLRTLRPARVGLALASECDR